MGRIFPLRPAFPIFIANCINWLSAQRQREQVTNIRTGEAVQIPLPAGTKSISLHYPDGHQEPIRTSGGVLNLEQVPRVGLYHVKGEGIDLPFTANLLDAGESDTTPRTQLKLIGAESSSDRDKESLAH